MTLLGWSGIRVRINGILQGVTASIGLQRGIGGLSGDLRWVGACTEG